MRAPIPAVLAFALLAAAQEEPPAAVVHGKALPRRAVFEELARRRFRGEDGEKALEQFLGDAVVRREQERRGVVVTEEEARAAVEDARRRMAEQLARRGEKVEGTDPLQRFLEESGFTLESFEAHTRHYIALQRLGRSSRFSGYWIPARSSTRRMQTETPRLPGRVGTSARREFWPSFATASIGFPPKLSRVLS